MNPDAKRMTLASMVAFLAHEATKEKHRASAAVTERAGTPTVQRHLDRASALMDAANDLASLAPRRRP